VAGSDGEIGALFYKVISGSALHIHVMSKRILRRYPYCLGYLQLMRSMPLARDGCPKRAIGTAAIAAVLLSGCVNAPSIGVLGGSLNAQLLSQEIALTKALGGGYRADPPVELKPR
jgi:hypothetical protein